jgi:hypothetical protein
MRQEVQNAYIKSSSYINTNLTLSTINPFLRIMFCNSSLMQFGETPLYIVPQDRLMQINHYVARGEHNIHTIEIRVVCSFNTCISIKTFDAIWILY